MAGTTGLEPATSDVTGRRSNQLNYVPAQAGKLSTADHAAGSAAVTIRVAYSRLHSLESLGRLFFITNRETSGTDIHEFGSQLRVRPDRLQEVGHFIGMRSDIVGHDHPARRN
jgi:hypothetical protein